MNKHHHALQQQTLIALIKFKLHAFCLLFFSLIIYQTNAQLSDPPHAVCKRDTPTFYFNGLGMVQVKASDLNLNSWDDNTPSADLQYYFDVKTKEKVFIIYCDEIISQGDIPCDFLGLYYKLKLFVEDKDGLIDSCVTIVKLEDALSLCPFSGFNSIKVSIHDQPSPNKKINCRLSRDGVKIDSFYGPGGITLYCNLYKRNLSLNILRDENHLNGVTTADIVQIQKHILGKERIINPLLLLAADVTNSKSISASDVFEIRRLILGSILKFTKVKSWIFMNSNIVLKDIENPWLDYNENYEWKHNGDREVNLNFEEIKMGDVNHTANNKFIALSNRSKVVIFKSNTQETSTKLNYTLSTTQTNTLEGIQFALRYDADALEFESIRSDVMDITAENYYIDPSGIIKFSWSDPNMLHIDARDKIINIHFHKKNIAALGNIYLDNSVMPNEWIDGNDEINTIKIEQPHVLPNIIVNSILPNPVKQEAIINIYSTTASKIKIARRTLQGQIIQQLEPLLQAGTNLVTLDCTDHPNGVYILQIQTADQIINKKIIIQKE